MPELSNNQREQGVRLFLTMEGISPQEQNGLWTLALTGKLVEANKLAEEYRINRQARYMYTETQVATKLGIPLQSLRPQGKQ